jgi:hypothetical protein
MLVSHCSQVCRGAPKGGIGPPKLIGKLEGIMSLPAAFRHVQVPPERTFLGAADPEESSRLKPASPEVRKELQPQGAGNACLFALEA